MNKLDLLKNLKYKHFVDAIGIKRVKFAEPLSLRTSFKIGGPADLYYKAVTFEELQKVVTKAHQLKIPFFILGSGTNILVADTGFRGLVIKSAIKTIRIMGKTSLREVKPLKVGTKRYEDYTKEFLSFSDLTYSDPPFDTKLLVGSGVSLAYLIKWSLDNGLTGLEWFSGIPGSIGGAVINNIHGGDRLFLSRVVEIHLLNSEGKTKKMGVSDLMADYDYTVLQKTGEIIVEVVLMLSSCEDTKAAKRVAKLWRERKTKIQPQTNCPGCIFKNISQSERAKLGWPTTSVGYIFDKLLDWKGKVGVGEAVISEKHGNFIVNKGGAMAKDVVTLMKKMKSEVKKRFAIVLEPEIQFVGFKKDPLDN